jgi:hypothetical protein
MLWRALPAIEELQTAWEAKCDNPRYATYQTAINDGLAKLNKYYSLVFKGPVHRTEKKTETGLNRTD